MTDERVKPTLPGGFNDYGPAEMAARLRMLDTIRSSFERFGFVPLDTPCVEFEEVLLGKSGETEKQVFRIRASEKDEGKPLALRFDLTVPLSRYVAGNGDLTFPFKRYQLGDVFRGESPQAGRYRQFKQFDADIVGAGAMLADAEIIAVMDRTLAALGVTRFRFHVNNRKVLNGLARTLHLTARPGFDENALAQQLMRVLDKLDSIGVDGVLAELQRTPEGPSDPALALAPEDAGRVRAYLAIAGTDDEKLAALRAVIGEDESGREAVDELAEVLGYLPVLGVPAGRAHIDLSIARGLDYYTGTVVETRLLDLTGMGSIMSGGRYDGLVGRFAPSPLPAVGASIGVDRLFAAMKQLGLVPEGGTTVDALVTVMDADQVADYLGVARVLRDAGLNTDLYYGANRSFKAQMRFALRTGVRFLVIRGETERAAGAVQLKDLKERRQEEVPLERAAALLREWKAS